MVQAQRRIGSELLRVAYPIQCCLQRVAQAFEQDARGDTATGQAEQLDRYLGSGQWLQRTGSRCLR